MAQNYFKFNNTSYTELDGVPTGSPSIPLPTEIFMDYLESSFLVTSKF